ncbi:MAG: NAD(P)H-hydrate dehydratase [Verrucomicrobiota bacterium]
MAAITVREMLAAETAAISRGWTEASLLQTAGEALGHALARMFRSPGTAVAFIGKGHNAGDALIALSVLRDFHGWKIAVRRAFPIDAFAPLVRDAYDRLSAPDFFPDDPALCRPLLILDGLLGTGTTGPLREPLATAADEINRLREMAGAIVMAVDVPSGVNPDSGISDPGSVTPDATFMIGNAKTGLLTGSAASSVGRLAVVDVPCLTHSAATARDLICPQIFAASPQPRLFDFHKGMAGRVSIVAGSEGYEGAAVLTSIGALRGGAGLITLFVPPAARLSVLAKCPPEIMVRAWDRTDEVLEIPHDALVVGPGLGDVRQPSRILDLIGRSQKPTILDADALNLIAANAAHDLFSAHHVITPHPGEFCRLAPDLADHSRESACENFIARHPPVLLLKGSRTLVCQRGNPVMWVNSTGTPAMATGGQGDLLAGVIGALAAGGASGMDAAALGTWLCGRAAEIAADDRHGGLSATPSDVSLLLGAALRDWLTRSR